MDCRCCDYIYSSHIICRRIVVPACQLDADNWKMFISVIKKKSMVNDFFSVFLILRRYRCVTMLYFRHYWLLKPDCISVLCLLTFAFLPCMWQAIYQFCSLILYIDDVSPGTIKTDTCDYVYIS